LENCGEKLIIDLSIPYNVATDARELSTVHLVNVDDLSKLKDATLQKRKGEVPKAQAIIREHITEFMEWFEMRKHAPVLKAIKNKLQQIHTFPLYNQLSPDISFTTTDTDKKIQRVINGMAVKLRVQNQRGCQYIEAINEFLATGSD
jgi:glutamyl-tRNA reductase